jgi:hypothetical protein
MYIHVTLRCYTRCPEIFISGKIRYCSVLEHRAVWYTSYKCLLYRTAQKEVHTNSHGQRDVDQPTHCSRVPKISSCSWRRAAFDLNTHTHTHSHTHAHSHSHTYSHTHTHTHTHSLTHTHTPTHWHAISSLPQI